MRFTLIDRITELKPNESITAIKALSLAEEYLHDHFPLFPVMPGVLMLEAACQTGAWLVRKSEDFAHSMVLLKEARNVKYADFVKPGQMLIVTCNVLKQDVTTTTLKFQGELDGKTGVSGRLVLERFNIADRTPTAGRRDKFMIEFQKSEFDLLYEPTES